MEIFQSGRRAIRLDVHEPIAPGRYPAILLLHGAGGNAGFWLDRIAPLVNSFGVCVYAAHYFDRTGTERAGPEHLRDGVHVPQWIETIGDALQEIAGRPRVDPTRIALIGISLGAFLSLALATAPAVPSVRAIVELSGGLVPPYEEAATRSFPPTLIVHGEADTVVPVAHAVRLARRLSALGVEHESKLLAQEGHWFSSAAQANILLSVSLFLRQHLF